MVQPLSYVDLLHSNHVCHLKKSIYGLKQGPRVLYTTLQNFLEELGFHLFKFDHSLFMYQQNGITLYVFIYVDDIPVVGNSFQPISWCNITIPNKFSIKDLKPFGYFLNLKAILTS